MGVMAALLILALHSRIIGVHAVQLSVRLLWDTLGGARRAHHFAKEFHLGVAIVVTKCIVLAWLASGASTTILRAHRCD